MTVGTAVTVEPGSHVNGDKPRGQYLIPLRLAWEAGPVSAVAVRYPPSEELKVGEENLLVLTGAFVVQTDFQAAFSAMPGPATLKGKLHYQACNTQMCFRPATAEVSLPVVIE